MGRHLRRLTQAIGGITLCDAGDTSPRDIRGPPPTIAAYANV
jgi:hypothetical protein